MRVQVTELDPLTCINVTDAGITSFYNEERNILLIKVIYAPAFIAHILDSIHESIGATMKADGPSSEDDAEASARLKDQFKMEVEDHYNRFANENKNAECPQIIITTNFNFLDHVYREAMVAQENGMMYDTNTRVAETKKDVFAWYDGEISVTFKVSESEKVKYIAIDYME